jgi:hypothetical protein
MEDIYLHICSVIKYAYVDIRVVSQTFRNILILVKSDIFLLWIKIASYHMYT